nr:tetratricopeptide repeat protein [Roseofilum sp. Belize Diploria]
MNGNGVVLGTVLAIALGMGFPALSSAEEPSADEFYRFGVVLQQEGLLEEAIAQYREALRLNPQLAQVYVNLGVALMDRGDREGAISAYQQALQVDPGLGEAYTGIRISIQIKSECLVFQTSIASSPFTASWTSNPTRFNKFTSNIRFGQ